MAKALNKSSHAAKLCVACWLSKRIALPGALRKGIDHPKYLSADLRTLFLTLRGGMIKAHKTPWIYREIGPFSVRLFWYIMREQCWQVMFYERCGRWAVPSSVSMN